ncbi:site-specific DNA-methyltransferase [Anabaena sp. UHCC 0451]|uniref:DNA-methyltransferase n=1 Tax=Anabaena sp. UHCC 0451 TaxID=2055235 RepID=UPI002B1F7E80|nr:site-specific DNA-methyltransferase [Anabaena sp. UHCC 0451]MEA5576337.1 site-specific DNA-methyltransferase [Anabaena sp. UHCC 0451]
MGSHNSTLKVIQHSLDFGVLESQNIEKDVQPLKQGFQLQYTHHNGKIYQGNSLDWLASIESESVDLVFADPPYNIKKAEWDNFENQEKYIEWSIQWIRQASRILKSTGSLYVCGFSEILADLKYPSSKYFKNCRWLIWHYKNKANLGSDWGRSHESIIHFRKSDQAKINIDDVRIPYGAHTLKYPSHPQAETSAYGKGKTKKNNNWTPNPKGAKPKDVIEIPTTCNGMGETTPHPTQKPEELLRKFVLASSQEGDLIIDPFSGSGTTLVVAEQLNRRWMGCDLNIDYNSWAINRLKNVRRMTKEEWIAFDRKNSERRESIR